MNEIEKLASISENLKDFLVSINWEERTFMVALSIFENSLKSTGIIDSKQGASFIGEIANSSINAAKIFIDKYKNNLQNS